jgi:hypothetical protein
LLKGSNSEAIETGRGELRNDIPPVAGTEAPPKRGRDAEYLASVLENHRVDELTLEMALELLATQKADQAK